MKDSHDPIDLELLARYFNGTASDDERSLIESRVDDDPVFERMIAGLKEMWNEAGRHAAGMREAARPPADWDTDAAWQKLQGRISRMPAHQSTERTWRTPHVRRTERAAVSRNAIRRYSLRPSQRLRTSVVGVALLVLMIGGGISYLALRGTAPSTEQADQQVFTAARGQQSVVTLVDGTSVRLKSESRLIVPASFAASYRTVRLQGEAYFEVAATGAPFVVRGEHVIVQVLGTEFAVSSYPQETSRVVVAEGTVEVSDARRPSYDAERLDAGELAVLESDGVRIQRDPEAVARYLAWTEQLLVFQETPFDQMVRELERWYDLQIDTSAVSGADVGWISATLSDEPLTEALRIVTRPLQLRFEVDGDEVRLFQERSNDR